MRFAGTFLSKKFPAPSKISLRPHIPCASGNRLCNVYGNRYRIYVLKSMQERFYSAKFLKSQISIIQLIIFFRKTQCNCVLIKVLLDFFQKIAWCGTESHGFNQSDKFVFVLRLKLTNKCICYR